MPEAVGPGLILEDPDKPDLDAIRALLEDPEAGTRAHAWVKQTHGPAQTRTVLEEVLA